MSHNNESLPVKVAEMTGGFIFLEKEIGCQ